ncbi:hypothetical protein [Burkholderia ambifaria]|uniref:hypothetical protein n=1 Tax=Burkholderia ambifaria TaxID=152480 RepID=UPI001FC8A1AC|nr:hypothetical protein [Burkholderia ambifaria]
MVRVDARSSARFVRRSIAGLVRRWYQTVTTACRMEMQHDVSMRRASSVLHGNNKARGGDGDDTLVGRSHGRCAACRNVWRRGLVLPLTFLLLDCWNVRPNRLGPVVLAFAWIAPAQAFVAVITGTRWPVAATIPVALLAMIVRRASDSTPLRARRRASARAARR